MLREWLVNVMSSKSMIFLLSYISRGKFTYWLLAKNAQNIRFCTRQSFTYPTELTTLIERTKDVLETYTSYLAFMCVSLKALYTFENCSWNFVTRFVIMIGNMLCFKKLEKLFNTPLLKPLIFSV